MERLLRTISTMLLTAGLVVLVNVALTLLWKEPVSTVYGSIQQSGAASELDDLAAQFPAPSDLEAIADVEDVSERARILARSFTRHAEEGDAIGRIRMPAIDTEHVFVEGTETQSLRRGPGHYPETGMPGQGRTVGIAGHRTTYMAPFRRLDDLEAGDRVTLDMPYASFSYRVEGTRIVTPDQVGVVRDVGYERLVLTACHPLYSAAERIVVFAELEAISLFGAADGLWQSP